MLRLFLLQPETIFAARVNMPSGITYPLDSLTFDGVTTGAFGDILPGQTLLLGSAAGLDDLGRQRVRAAASSSAIPVGRSSQGVRDGELNVSDNAYITVLHDFRIWAKIQYIDAAGAIFKDSGIAYSDQTIEPPPVANTGPGVAGTIDSGSSLLTVAFDGSASFATAAGASITNYSWDGDGGAVVGGGPDKANVKLAFVPGG
jgi:hypothetical protein